MKTGHKNILLADLCNTSDHRDVLKEIKTICGLIDPEMDVSPVLKAHKDVVSLYSGEYPGYAECTTGYHDLSHTMDVYLAMARLIHGSIGLGHSFSHTEIALGLISALLHDAGYVTLSEDTAGSGGRFTTVHVERSMDFARKYLTGLGFSKSEVSQSALLIESTSLSKTIDSIGFKRKSHRLMGRLLFSADLLGQMSDRVYLEKLHMLYIEFLEADIDAYKDAEDLLRKTIGFYEMIIKRINNEVPDLEEIIKTHFTSRWGMPKDMYSASIEQNIAYLRHILSEKGSGYKSMLKRRGILQRLQQG